MFSLTSAARTYAEGGSKFQLPIVTIVRKSFINSQVPKLANFNAVSQGRCSALECSTKAPLFIESILCPRRRRIDERFGLLAEACQRRVVRSC